MMQQIKDIIPKQLMEGINGYFAHGKNMSFGYVEIKEATVMPVCVVVAHETFYLHSCATNAGRALLGTQTIRLPLLVSSLAAVY